MSRTISSRNPLLAGTALAGLFLTGYGRAIAGTCVGAVNPVLCAGPAIGATDVTQVITFTPTITQATTTPGFGISTAAGDAIDLNGSGTFGDPNASSITGAAFGIYGMNTGAGALSITTTGAVTGHANAAIYGYNAPTATALTISAASATGNTQGISARNYGTGALSVTASGTVTGTTKAGIFAYERGGSGLTINAAAVSGGNSGINAINTGAGLLSITTSGAVSGAGTGSPGAAGAYRTGSGIYAYAGGTGGVLVNAGGPVTETGSGSIGVAVEAAASVTGNVTITTANSSGTNHGIFAQNNGSGTLSITATGTTNGNTKSGIAAFSANGLTINANAVNGGGSGIYAHTTGAGMLSITTTGAVKSNGSTGGPATMSGIYAAASGTGAISVSASGAVSATGPASYGIHTSVDNGTTTIAIATGGSARGSAGGILASGSQPIAITNAGTIANTSGLVTDEAIAAFVAPTTLDNTGTITGTVRFDNFANTLDFTSGAINGSVDMGNGAGNVAELTGLGAANLSGLLHLNAGTAGGSTLTFDGVTYQGGSFDTDSLALGVNLETGWTNVALTHATAWTLTGNLTLRGAATLTIDPSSTLFAGNGDRTISAVAPAPAIIAARAAETRLPVATVGAAALDPNAFVAMTNSGTLDLTNGGVTPSTLTIVGTYAQTASGTLVIGVTPGAIDLVNVAGTASLGGAVRFAFAPGTYVDGTRAFLTSAGLGGTSFTSASYVGAPSTITETVTYTATDADLVIATATPT
jgi:hypothetical protein